MVGRKEMRHHAILRNQGISLTAHHDTGFAHDQSQLLRQCTVGIAQKHNAGSGSSTRFPPGLHDVGIVGGNANGEVNPLSLQVILSRNERWEVALAASRSKGTGDGKHGNFFALDKFQEFDFYGRRIVWLALHEGDIGEGVSDFDNGSAGHGEGRGGKEGSFGSRGKASVSNSEDAKDENGADEHCTGVSGEKERDVRRAAFGNKGAIQTAGSIEITQRH